MTVFADPRSLTIYDSRHSANENRFHTIGLSQKERVLLVVHCDRAERIRLISARKATLQERRLYEAQDR